MGFPASQIKDFILHCGKLRTKYVSRKVTDDNQHFPRSPEACTVFQIYLTYAHILRFPRISLAGILELRFASFSRKVLETMFCLIWYGLVTSDFTTRIFKNLLTLRPVYSMACFASRQLATHHWLKERNSYDVSF